MRYGSVVNSPHLIRPNLNLIYFFANDIFIGCVGVILNPCKVSLAWPATVSFSNSTKAISLRPGTSLTSLNPGNLKREVPMINTRSYTIIKGMLGIDGLTVRITNRTEIKK